MDKTVIFTYLRFAEKLADATQSVVLKYFRSKLNIKNKPDGSPVSEADTHADIQFLKLFLGLTPYTDLKIS